MLLVFKIPNINQLYEFLEIKFYSEAFYSCFFILVLKKILQRADVKTNFFLENNLFNFISKLQTLRTFIVMSLQ